MSNTKKIAVKKDKPIKDIVSIATVECNKLIIKDYYSQLKSTSV